MILEMSLDLLHSSKTSADARPEGLVSNEDYLEIQHRNFTQKKYGRKNVYCARTFRSLDCNFSFCTDFLHYWWLLKIEKNK